jgi:hypothetical protein
MRSPQHGLLFCVRNQSVWSGRQQRRLYHGDQCGCGERVHPREAGWDPNSESDLGGYKLYYWKDDTTNQVQIVDVGNKTNITVQLTAPASTYRFYLTAYNTGGLGVRTEHSGFRPDARLPAKPGQRREQRPKMKPSTIVEAILDGPNDPLKDFALNTPRNHKLTKNGDGTYGCACGRWGYSAVDVSPSRAREEYSKHVKHYGKYDECHGMLTMSTIRDIQHRIVDT